MLERNKYCKTTSEGRDGMEMLGRWSVQGGETSKRAD